MWKARSNGHLLQLVKYIESVQMLFYALTSVTSVEHRSLNATAPPRPRPAPLKISQIFFAKNVFSVYKGRTLRHH